MKKLAVSLKISLGFLLLSIILTIVFYFTDWVLGTKGLMLRENASNAFFIGIIVPGALFLIFLFIFLVKNAADNLLKTSKRVVNGLLAFLVFVILGFSSIFFVVAFTFAEQPEHEVTRDGKKLVASVSSYLQVEVNYREYVSPFVMKKDVVLWEDYGDGSFDPFTVHPTPKVKRSSEQNSD